MIAPSKNMCDSIWRFDFSLAQSMSWRDWSSCSISCSISWYIVVHIYTQELSTSSLWLTWWSSVILIRRFSKRCCSKSTPARNTTMHQPSKSVAQMSKYTVQTCTWTKSYTLVTVKLCWMQITQWDFQTKGTIIRQARPTFLCFESPTALFASQHNLFRTMWPDCEKGHCSQRYSALVFINSQNNVTHKCYNK